MDADTCEQRADGQAFPGSDSGVTGVLSDELGYVWNDVKPMLQRALAPWENTDQILTRLFLGSMQLWVAVEHGTVIAAMTTEILHEGDRKLCNIAHLGGTGLNNWLSYLPTIEEWAKAQNCTAIKIARARLGWQRILTEYKPTTITLEKEL